MRKKTNKTVYCFILLFFVCLSAVGCQKTDMGSHTWAESQASDAHILDKRVRDYLDAQEDPLGANDPRARDVLMRTARAAMGTPYVSGGTSINGFDCSGFVQWTFNKVGVQLPRTAREQSRVGYAVRNTDDMQAGDIVAFRHPRRGYHTGIYVGDGKFIHSPRRRTSVRINDLNDPYFSGTFLGARRVQVSNPEDIEAAEKMLSEYRQQRHTKAAQTQTRTIKQSSVGKKTAQKSGVVTTGAPKASVVTSGSTSVKKTSPQKVAVAKSATKPSTKPSVKSQPAAKKTAPVKNVKKPAK